MSVERVGKALCCSSVVLRRAMQLKGLPVGHLEAAAVRSALHEVQGLGIVAHGAVRERVVTPELYHPTRLAPMKCL